MNIFSVKESVLLDNVLEKQTSSKESDITFNSEQKEGEPDWKEMFTKGMENREKHLLTEYTTILRSYKDMKKYLDETKTNNCHKRRREEKMSLLLLQKDLSNTNDLTETDDYSIPITPARNSSG